MFIKQEIPIIPLAVSAPELNSALLAWLEKRTVEGAYYTDYCKEEQAVLQCLGLRDLNASMAMPQLGEGEQASLAVQWRPKCNPVVSVILGKEGVHFTHQNVVDALCKLAAKHPDLRESVQDTVTHMVERAHQQGYDATLPDFGRLFWRLQGVDRENNASPAR